MAINSTNTVGYTESTPDHLLLNAGAIYKNYGLAAESLIGATASGGEFESKIKTRQLKVGGILSSNVKGLTMKIDEEVTLKCDFLEMTTEILKMALMANVDTTTNPDYDIITGKDGISSTDYLDNVAIVSTLSGSDKPVVIILKNALCKDGVKIKGEDAKDNTLPVIFTANVDPLFPKVSCYEIHYPKLV